MATRKTTLCVYYMPAVGGGDPDCLGVEDGGGGERDGNDGGLGQGLHASERRHVERQCEPLKSYSSAARVSSAEL